MPSLNRRFGRLVLLSGAATIAGFATQILVAFHFGTSVELDAYWVALALATATCFFVHPLRESLIATVFTAARSKAEQASEALTAGTMLLLGLASAAALLLYLSANFTLFTPAGSDRESFSNLLVAFLPFIFLFAISETFNAVLLSLDLALHQASARLLSALATVACLALLAPSLGIYAMLFGVVFGQVVVLAASWQTLYARGLRWRFAGLAPLRNALFFPMFASLLLSYLFSQIYLVTERLTIGALQPGALSAFQYATLLVNVLISLVALPLSNLLWPRFLELESAGDRSGMGGLAWETARPIMFVLLAMAAFTFHAASDIISLVYERGSFDTGSHQQTVAALRLTAFASIPIALVTIALRALMAQGRSLEVAGVGLLMAIVGMSVLGTAWLSTSLPLAQSHWLIANACGALLAWQWIIREAPAPTALGLRISRSSLLSAAAVGLPLLLMPHIDFGDMLWQLVLSLVVQTLIYAAMVWVLAVAVRLADIEWLMGRLRSQ